MSLPSHAPADPSPRDHGPGSHHRSRPTLRVVQDGETSPAPRPAAPRPPTNPAPILAGPALDPVAVALVAEFLAGVVSLALSSLVGWAAFVLVPVVVTTLVVWLVRSR